MSEPATQPQPKVTQLAPKTEQAEQPAKTPAVIPQTENYDVGMNNRNGFELLQRTAFMLSQSSLMPKDFRNNIPNCAIAVNMAYRIGADPLMVAQNLYVVHGRPGWSAKFLIATFNMCGRFSALRYEFIGEKGKDTWGCRAWSIEKDTGEKLVGPEITIGLAKAEKWYDKDGSKWKTIPQKMLMYRAGAWFIDLYGPEISMGIQTADEIEDLVASDRGDEPASAIAQGKVNIDGEVVTGETKKPGLEGFKERHGDKPEAETVNTETGEVTPTPTPAATAAPKPKTKQCDECVGTGIIHSVEEGQEVKGPCSTCGGKGKV